MQRRMIVSGVVFFCVKHRQCVNFGQSSADTPHAEIIAQAGGIGREKRRTLTEKRKSAYLWMVSVTTYDII
jgi:hypothetical protein